MTASAADCLDELRVRAHTLATAESLTAGLVCSALAAVPGASDVLRGGVVAYASDVKASVLGVDAELIEQFGVVSRPCAAAMAAAARRVLAADWALATTGVAGPTEQDGQPVGLVFVAVSGPDVEEVEEHRFVGDRNEIRTAAADAAIQLLGSALLRGRSSL